MERREFTDHVELLGLCIKFTKSLRTEVSTLDRLEPQFPLHLSLFNPSSYTKLTICWWR